MGNSPSSGLGGGSTHSSRDVRLTDPEKEVERPPASRAPTHKEYIELPASSKPHTYPNTLEFIILLSFVITMYVVYSYSYYTFIVSLSRRDQ